MYNKKAMRKLSEDCWDAAVTWYSQLGMDSQLLTDNKQTYITTRLAALDDGDEPKEYYVPVPVTKFGDLPTPMTEVVVFFKNRKEPWVAYREIDDIWFFETGESCKTPTHWLKKIKK